MPHKNLPYIKPVRRGGKVYEYFRTGKKVDGREELNPLPARTDRAFGQIYAGMLAARTARANMPVVPTIASVSKAYQQSNKFTDRSANTKRAYGYALARIEDQMGDAPVNQVERSDVQALMDKLSNQRASANMTLAVLRNLFAFARDRGLIKSDPSEGMDDAGGDAQAYAPWPEPLLERALVDPEVMLAVSLLYYTAQRIGDVCKMRWSDYRDNHMYVKQQKTGKELDIRVHRDLAAVLDVTPRTSITILAGAKGRPLNPETQRRRLQKWAAKHGERVVAHGLRKNAVMSLLERGCTIAETSAISGQSLGMVEHYARQRDNRRISSAAILKWEGTDDEHGKQWKTGGANRA